jgi:hypothetical protein
MLRGSRFGDSSGNDLYFAPVASACATADADEIHIQLTGASQERLVAGAFPAAANRFEIDGEQWIDSFPCSGGENQVF